MSHTDKQLRDSTQVAYMHVLEKSRQDLIKKTGKNIPYSIRELILNAIPNKEEIIKRAISDGKLKEGEEISFELLLEYADSIEEWDKTILANASPEILDWKIVDTINDNDRSGMCACIIETSEQEAIVAFRGSEESNPKKDPQSTRNDWVEGDAGLFQSDETFQQGATEAYAKRIIQKKILDKYERVSVAGHSLGGNLASHFGVVSAKEGNESLFDKIDRVANFDGPGVSKMYLEKHKKEIARIIPKMTHYQWSLVGTILNNLEADGKTERRVFPRVLPVEKINEKTGRKYAPKVYSIIGKHDSRAIEFDSEGKVVSNEQLEKFEQSIQKATSSMDKAMPHAIPRGLYSFISIMLNTAINKRYGFDSKSARKYAKYYGMMREPISTLENYFALQDLSNLQIADIEKLILDEATSILNGHDLKKEAAFDIMQATRMHPAIKRGLVQRVTSRFTKGAKKKPESEKDIYNNFVIG